MNEKLQKNHGGILTKLLISPLLIALESTKLDIKVMPRHRNFT